MPAFCCAAATRAVADGEVENTEEVKYIHGNYGRGTYTFYGGHDPEDYQHAVGDPPTDLSLHKNSPGYRLILNNILFPAAEKKEQKTRRDGDTDSRRRPISERYRRSVRPPGGGRRIESERPERLGDTTDRAKRS